MRKEFVLFFLIVLFLGIGYKYANHSQDMNFYRVTVGNHELAYQVIEETTRFYIQDVLEANIHEEGFYQGEYIETSSIHLHIDKLACLEKTGGRKINCKTFYRLGKTPITEKIEEEPVSLVIMKEDEVLYDDSYIEDIKSYVTLPGRYYFIVTYETSTFKAIKKTKLLFSIKVVNA